MMAIIGPQEPKFRKMGMGDNPKLSFKGRLREIERVAYELWPISWNSKKKKKNEYNA